MSPIPRYRCHKEVNAFKILYAALDGDIVTLEGDGHKVVETRTWVEKHNPLFLTGLLSTMLGGYYVQYDDGYTSFSPAKAFEEGYTRI